MRLSELSPIVVLTFSLCLGVGSVATANVPAETNLGLTETDCQEFAERLTRAVEKGDVGACSELFDENGIIDSFFEGIDFGPNNREQMIAKWKQGFLANHVLFQPLVTNCALGGSFRFAAARPNSTKGQLVMRSLSPQGAAGYQVLTLARRGDGKFVINDAHSMSSAGPSTLEIVRATVSHFTRFDGPDGKIRPDAPNAEKLVMDKRVLSGIFQSYAKQDYSSVCYYYTRLSPELQNDRLAMLLMLNAAVQIKSNPVPPGIPVKPEEMEAKRNDFIKSKIEQYRATYPDDSAIELAATSFYLNTRQYAAAISSVDSFEKSIGNDPYLNVLRAQIYLLDDNVKRAAATADDALEKLPDMSAAYEVALDVAVRAGNNDRAITILDQMRGRFGGELSDGLKSDPKMKEFLGSPEYLEWKSKSKSVNKTDP